jgi:hypothetical protein
MVPPVSVCNVREMNRCVTGDLMASVRAQHGSRSIPFTRLLRDTALIGWLCFVVGFWTFFVAAMIASYGIFDWVGYDYAPFWAAGQAVLTAGPAASYDLETLTRLAAPLQSSLGPQSSGLAVAPGLYPPIFFVLLAPFALLPGPVSFVAWTITQAALGIYVVASLARRFPARRFLVAAVAFFSFPLTLVLFFGQSTILPLVALHEAVRNFERGREFRAGLWLGTLFIKPQYALVFPLILIYKRRWRALAGMVACLIPLGVSSILFLGAEGIANYRELSGLYSGFRQTYLSVHPHDMINWRGLLVNLAPQLSETQGQATTLAVSACTLLLLIPIWRGRWAPRADRFAMQLLATMIIVLITSYHSHIHGAALLIVPGMMVVTCRLVSGALRILLSASVFTLPLVFAALLSNSSLTAAWQLTTRLVVLWLFVALVLCLRQLYSGEYGVSFRFSAFRLSTRS